ncbi:hypothetical protein AGMMS50212_01070 [Spirochaetia bacterium]|nr:hypothetical protein AGMMS50212_01070 [Spirochaetia bacterium]
MRIFIFLLVFFVLPCAHSQQINDWAIHPSKDFVAGAHRGNITGIVQTDKDHVLTGGADGFLILWNEITKKAEERFQVSPYSINSIALRKGKKEIAAAESDNFGLNYVSVWNYEKKEKLFSFAVNSTILFCDYSYLGNFIIITTSGQGLLLLDANTGKAIEHSISINSDVTFALTSNSERTLMTYSSSGTISYWDMEKQIEKQSVSVPSRLKSPAVFGKNMFFAGFNNDGLVVFNVVSGKVLARQRSVPQGIIISPNVEDVLFSTISGNSKGQVSIRTWTIDKNGTLVSGSTKDYKLDTASFVCALFSGNNEVVLGTNSGTLYFTQNGGGKFEFKEQKLVKDIAAFDTAIAWTGNNSGGFIPADFSILLRTNEIDVFNTNTSNRVSVSTVKKENEEFDFLFWQNESLVTSERNNFPLVASANGFKQDADGTYQYTKPVKFTSRYAIRSASVYGSSALFLDTSGNISVYSTETGALLFTYKSVIAYDAVFADKKTIIVAQNANNKGSGFLLVNTVTGETLPLDVPSSMALQVYRSPLNNIYGAIITLHPSKTSIIKLNLENPSDFTVLQEYEGEDSDFCMTETNGVLSSTLGSKESTFIYSGNFKTAVEQSAGMTSRLAAASFYLISLDEDGSICWHDTSTGKLLAVLRLYENEWLLSTSKGEIKRGTLEIK